MIGRTLGLHPRRLFSMVALLSLASVACEAHAQIELLDMFPSSSQSALNTNNWSYSQSNNVDLSGSKWERGLDETDVYHSALKHNQSVGAGVGANNQDWEIRIGKGGQIYSIVSEVGEIIPPQAGHSQGNSAPWVDEVFQSVSVDTKNLNANGERVSNPNNEVHFYHQSGYYAKGAVSKPTYSPMLASGNVGPNAYATMSLAVQADSTGPQHRPSLLNWQRTKDLGDGVIEVTHTMYNFGEDSVDFHNIPWGGTRNSVFDQMLVSNPDGGFTNQVVDSFDDWQNQVLKVSDTGGWAAFTEKSSRGGPVVGTDRGMAIVFGDTDNNLAEDWQPKQSSWRWGGTGRTRDYLVGTLRRMVYVDPGDVFTSRYFMVLGDVDHIQSTIEERGLVADATYDMMTTEESAASLLGWQVVNTDGVISVEETLGAEVDFHTFAQPVNGSKPLFILEDVDGNEHLSTDPYALSANPYDGLTTYKGILGFVMPGDMTTNSNNYTNLSSIFQSDSQQGYYLDSNMHVLTSAIPEPTTLTLLLGTGLAVLCQRRKRK